MFGSCQSSTLAPIDVITPVIDGGSIDRSWLHARLQGVFSTLSQGVKVCSNDGAEEEYQSRCSTQGREEETRRGGIQRCEAGRG